MSLMPEFFEPDAHLFFVFRHCSSGDVVKDKDEKIIAFSWLKLRDAVRAPHTHTRPGARPKTSRLTRCRATPQ